MCRVLAGRTRYLNEICGHVSMVSYKFKGHVASISFDVFRLWYVMKNQRWWF